MRHKSFTPEEVCRVDTSNLIKDVLGDEYRELTIDSFSFEEHYSDPSKPLEVRLVCSLSAPTLQSEIDATGVGVLDAAFKGLQSFLGDKYKSLMHISLYSFYVYTNLHSPASVESTEDNITIVVEFTNAYGKVVPFRSSSYSLTESMVLCLSSAFEYYINSECCFLKLRSLIKEAESRGRSDIKAEYVSNLINIVGVSSYEEVL